MQPAALFRRLAWSLPVLIVAGALAVSLNDPLGARQRLADLSFDLLQRFEPRPAAHPEAIYIDIDAETVNRLGHWPWPRPRLSRLIEAVHEAGASLVVLDETLADPDPTSPEQAIALWPPLPPEADAAAVSEALRALPRHDAVLAAGLRKGPVILSLTPGKGENRDEGARLPPAAWLLRAEGGDPLDFVPPFSEWTQNLPAFERAAVSTGAHLPAGARTQTVRRLPLFVALDGELLPATALEAARLEAGASRYGMRLQTPRHRFDLARAPGIHAIEAGPRIIPVMPDGTLHLWFRAERQGASVPAWRFLDNGNGRVDLTGRIAVIGVSKNGIDKFYTTPIGALPSGAIMAEALDQILSGVVIERPDWAAAAEMLALALGSFLILLTVLAARRRPWPLFLTLLFIGCAAYGTWYAFTDRLWLFHPVLPILTFALVYAVAAALNRLRIDEETRFIENQFTHRLPKARLRRLIAQPRRIRRQGTGVDITSFVGGLRGFNIIADRYLETPEAYADILNRFFTPATKLVHDRRGMIERYMGETMHAVWNTPFPEADHAARACDAALRMTEQLDTLNEFLQDDANRRNVPYVPVSVSIGIDSGSAIAGNLGAHHNFDYGVAGEPVTFAAYLQRHARHYGPAIIVGEGAARILGERYALLEVDLIATPRHATGWRAYALLGDGIVRASPKFRALKEAHTALFEAYRSQRWAEARAVLREARKLNGAIETLYDLYEQRITHFEASPPGPAWTGVWYAGRI